MSQSMYSSQVRQQLLNKAWHQTWHCTRSKRGSPRIVGKAKAKRLFTIYYFGLAFTLSTYHYYVNPHALSHFHPVSFPVSQILHISLSQQQQQQQQLQKKTSSTWQPKRKAESLMTSTA